MWKPALFYSHHNIFIIPDVNTGKIVIRISMISSANMKGKIVLERFFTFTSVMEQIEKRLTPIGGVICPMARFSVIIMPK